MVKIIKIQDNATKEKITSASIEILTSEGKVAASSTPAGPDVKTVTEVSPGVYSVEALTEGDYTLKIAKADYIDIEQPFSIDAKGNVSLKPIPAKVGGGPKFKVKFAGKTLTFSMEQNIRLYLIFENLPDEDYKGKYSNGTEVPAGKLAPDGSLNLEKIPSDAKYLDLEFTKLKFTYHLNLELKSINTTKGVQARLNSLGYFSGKVDGDKGPLTTTAVRLFQDDESLAVTGAIDAGTKAKLLAEFKS